MKKLILLGSTGSIGTQTLDVVRAYPDLFQISALAAGRNTAAMESTLTTLKSWSVISIRSCVAGASPISIPSGS